jgi:hypothetical protein
MVPTSSTSQAQNLSNIPLSSTSGKKSTSTMRRTSAQAEIPLPITYTPTTHRISKAKKGKRVHACEYSGCNKVRLPFTVNWAELFLTLIQVFTRAEHKR